MHTLSNTAVVLLALVCIQVLILPAATQGPKGKRCPPIPGSPSCVCEHPDGKIDLTKVANFDGTPRYKDMRDINGYAYSYNPCKQFSDGCKDVSACQQDVFDPSAYYDIADSNEEMWIDDDGKVYLYYTGPIFREVYVYLTCDQTVSDAIVTADGDSTIILQYRFDMTSAHACPGGPK